MSKGFRGIAPHIRGRVFVLRTLRPQRARGSRRTVLYGMEVTNAHTGKVIASDNCTDLAKLVTLAHEATAAARGAWTFNIKQAALK